MKGCTSIERFHRTLLTIDCIHFNLDRIDDLSLSLSVDLHVWTVVFWSTRFKRLPLIRMFAQTSDLGCL